MNLIEELIRRLSTKGDIGIALLGFVVGYLLDLKFGLLGLPPGRAGTLGMVAGVGLKNTAEAIRDFSSHRREASQSERNATMARENARRELEDSLDKALQLSAEVDQGNAQVAKMSTRIRRDRELWRNGLLREENLRVTINDFVQTYRNFHETEADQETIDIDAPKRLVRLED